MNVKVNEKIRMVRTLHQLTQAEMAEKLGMSTNGYAKIEQGDTNINTHRLEKIAQVFDMTVLELMSVGEKNIIYLINENGDNNAQQNFFGENSKDLKGKVEKLEMSLIHKDEIIARQQQEIESLKKIINILEKNTH